MKKYILTKNKKIVNGNALYQIQAVKNFGNIKKGDYGGWIKSEKNLSQYDNCWIYEDAKIFGNAIISGNARISGNAEISGDALICGNSEIYGNVQISGNARISGDARISGNAEISGNTLICGDVRIYRDAIISGNAKIFGNAQISGNVKISGNAEIYGNAEISGDAKICGNSEIYEDAKIFGNAQISGNVKIYGNAEIFGNAQISGDAVISFGTYMTGYINIQKEGNDIENMLINQCFVFPDDEGNFISYKRVNKISDGVYSSCYTSSFIYKDGEIAEEFVYNNSISSCAPGLHFSHPNYWNDGDTLISAIINIKDIIVINDGKIRCRKALVIGECKRKSLTTR